MVVLLPHARVSFFSYSNFECPIQQWNNGIIDFEIGMCGQAELLASLMRNRFLINHINIPTRKENSLDLILSNIPEWFADSRYEINQNFSDHNFVICELTRNFDENGTKKVMKMLTYTPQFYLL